MSAKQPNFHYNPDWLSDNALLENFVARQDDFAFLREELARAPLVGSAQHYLIVGLRGAGKTTLLKRLAIAIRNDADINDHLIALSFPEELYDVKNLSDFWWVACTALVDELDRLGQQAKADQLMDTIDRAKRASTDSLADTGLKLLLKTCEILERRPILLVDNLDFVFQRIDKKGRKLTDPHAPAYWALREALSTTTSPIVIGGSVRLSEPFTDYDKAFYDFFLPKRLGKLSFDEVRRVLERLADAQNLPGIKERLHTRPSRVEALYELTGGNPRAIGLIFELLRQGPNGRAVEDFERLMDNTTPYYKARFEDLSEQAQVVMHALAVRRLGNGSGLRFGHTAAEIGSHAGLATGTVSAQMDVLEREGLVEKSAAHGRTQYRIAEQLFRLWLQMRSNRRIRQNVIGLTEFLEAMYDFDELLTNLHGQSDTSALAEAKLCFAVADTCDTDQWRRGLEAQGADRLLQHVQDHGGAINDYLTSGELTEDLSAIVNMREQLQRCKGGGLTPQQQHALLGSVKLSQERKQVSVNALCSIETAPKEVAFLRQHFERERQHLLRYGLRNADLPLLFQKRAMGHLPLPKLTPEDAESICAQEKDAPALRSMVWRLVGTRTLVKITDESMAQEWLNWGMDHQREAPPTEWANVGGTMRRAGHLAKAQTALDQAFALGGGSRSWFEKGALLSEIDGKHGEAETAYRKAIELDPADPLPWNNLGSLLQYKLNRFDEAESAYRKAIELDPDQAFPWRNLGALLHYKLNRFDEAESAYREAIELDPAYGLPWNDLGNLLKDKLNRFDEAESAYRKAIELAPAYALPWNNLGTLLHYKLNRYDEAESAYRKAIELDSTDPSPWTNLGNLLEDKLKRLDEAETVFRKAIEINPTDAALWDHLAYLLGELQNRYAEAEEVCRKAININPNHAQTWNNLGFLLGEKLNKPRESEAAYRKALEIDPEYEWTWNNLGILLEAQDRIDEADYAYSRGAKLGLEAYPYWGRRRTELQTSRYTTVARQALESGNMPELRNILSRLLIESMDVAAALVSQPFVEGFLAREVAMGKNAVVLLDTLQDLGYQKHARPLLLAFEAAIESRPDRLADLEPEIQRATQHMFERLSVQKK